MPQKLRINLTVSRETKHDIERRDQFNASQFFEDRYKEEYMNAVAIKSEIEAATNKLTALNKKLLALKETNLVMKAKADPRRCQCCTMFFHEDIPFRKKIHVYKSLYVCKECSDQQQMKIKQMVNDIKVVEKEVEQ